MASPLKVEFHFDFGSPNAYLAELALPAIEQRTGVKFDYVPVLLGGVYKATGNMSPAEPKKMDDPQIFRDAFLSSGLDIDRIIARAQQDDVKKKLIENTDNAVARGTFGSPTFYVGDEIFFGKDRLREVEDEIVAQRAAERRKTA